MLVKLAEAIGRLVLAGRELTRLAGFTARTSSVRNAVAIFMAFFLRSISSLMNTQTI